MTKELLISSIIFSGVALTQVARAQATEQVSPAEGADTESAAEEPSAPEADAGSASESQQDATEPDPQPPATPEPTDPPELAETSSTQPTALETNTQQGDNDAVFRAFRVHARQETVNRFIRTGTGVAAGAALMGTGAILKRYQDVDPKYFYIVGGVSAGASLIGLFMKTDAEKIADRHGANESGHTELEAEDLKAAWSKYADKARSARFISAITSSVISVAGLGVGSAVAAGAFEMNDVDRSYLSSGLIVGGAAAMFPAIGGFVFKSSAETSYEAYIASEDVQQKQAISVELSLSPLPGGGAIGAFGTF